MSETLTVYRTEQHNIKKSNPYYKMLEGYSIKSKNLYNKCLYEERQFYFKHNQSIDYNNLYHLVKQSSAYKEMPTAQTAQSVIRQVANTFKYFQRAMAEYKNDESKFTGKPKIPKYKDKSTGRNIIELNYQGIKLRENTIYFPKAFQGLTLKTKSDNIVSATIVPKVDCITINIAYNKEITLSENKNLKWIAGLDIGIDNFATVSVWNNTSQPLIINGKGLKSYNKYFNKILSHLQSEAETKNGLKTTKRIKRLYQKRNNYMHNFMHKASRATVDYLLENNVKHLVIGNNTQWKTKCPLSKKVNQTFIQIPYKEYISLLTYKAREQGITVECKEESYTSGTSFLDNELPIAVNYNDKRRLKRGLFKSNNGVILNADVNASYQIPKKAFKNLIIDETKLTKQQLHNKLVPNRINVA